MGEGEWWQELDLDLPQEAEVHCTAEEEEGLHNSSPSLRVMKLGSPS